MLSVPVRRLLTRGRDQVRDPVVLGSGVRVGGEVRLCGRGSPLPVWGGKKALAGDTHFVPGLITDLWSEPRWPYHVWQPIAIIRR